MALGAAEARVLTDRIKTELGDVWQLIVCAYTERAWEALGYTTWDDYCSQEFGTARLRLPREERDTVVSSLRDLGLSSRAIASAIGSSQDPVERELRERNRLPRNGLRPHSVTGELIAPGDETDSEIDDGSLSHQGHRA